MPFIIESSTFFQQLTKFENVLTFGHLMRPKSSNRELRAVHIPIATPDLLSFPLQPAAGPGG